MASSDPSKPRVAELCSRDEDGDSKTAGKQRRVDQGQRRKKTLAVWCRMMESARARQSEREREKKH